MIYKELFFCFIKGCEWSCECHHAARYLPQPNSYFILWIFHSSSCDAACKFISSLAIFSWQLKASLLKSTKNSLFFIFQGIFLIGKDILRMTEVMFDFVWESNMTVAKAQNLMMILKQTTTKFGRCRGTVTSQVLLIWEEQQLQPLLGLGLGEAASVTEPLDLTLLGSGHLKRIFKWFSNFETILWRSRFY